MVLYPLHHRSTSHQDQGQSPHPNDNSLALEDRGEDKKTQTETYTGATPQEELSQVHSPLPLEAMEALCEEERTTFDSPRVTQIKAETKDIPISTSAHSSPPASPPPLPPEVGF